MLPPIRCSLPPMESSRRRALAGSASPTLIASAKGLTTEMKVSAFSLSVPVWAVDTPEKKTAASGWSGQRA